MSASKNETTMTNQLRQRPTRLERRAAETAALATQQATLKQEAAARRLATATVVPAPSRRGRHTTRG